MSGPSQPSGTDLGSATPPPPQANDPMGVWTLDVSGRTLTINPRMSQWLAATGAPTSREPAGIPTTLEAWIGTENMRSVSSALDKQGCAEIVQRFKPSNSADEVELQIRFQAWRNEGGARAGLMVTAIDRLEHTQKTPTTPTQNELNALLMRLSNAFIRSSSSDLDRAIETALGMLGRFARVSSCYLFQFDPAITSSSKQFEWRSKDVPSTAAAFTGITAESMPNLFPRAAAGEALRVNRLEELGEEGAAEREKLAALSIGAFMCLPVRVQGRVVGLLGFDQHGGGRVWTDDEELVLRLSTEMFAQALDRRRAHSQLTFHINNAPLGVVEWDNHWRVARWSPAAEEMFGWPAKDVLGRSWESWRFVHEDDLSLVADMTQRLIDGTDSANTLVNRNYTQDRREVKCEWFNSVLRDDQGQVVSILSFVQDITARQQDQNSLAVSQAQLKTLNTQLEERVDQRTAELKAVTRASDEQARTLQAMLDAGDDHVMLLDEAQRCVYVSRSLLSDLGRSESSMVSLTLPEAGMPAELAEMLTRFAKNALSRGQTLRQEEITLDTERGLLTFEYTFTPILDAIGCARRVLCTGHDITERMRAAAAVRESETRHRMLAEHVTDMISCHDDGGRFTYVSPACRRLLGYEPQELLGQLPRVIAHPDDRDTVTQSLARLRLTTDVVSTTFRARRKDGQTVWFESSSQSDGGEIVIVSRDVTRRLDTEQRLRLIQSAVEQVGESVTITDNQIDRPGPHIVYVNPVFTEMTGYTPEEALGRSPRILQGPKSDRRVLARLHQSLRQGIPFFGETINYRRDGGEYVVEWHVNPLRDGRGNITHWVAIQRDVTERKIAEDLARVHREELAHVTRLSTMGEMASGLAHELNQPLAAINNYASGALRRIERQTASTADLAQALQRVADQSNRAGQIIRRLRAFVVKRGTMRSPEHINGLIRETLALLEADIIEHQGKIKLDLIPDAECPLVHVDGIQIEQVLVNIIHNALEAMAACDPDLRQLVIATRCGDDHTVHVTLCDSGPGLTPSQRDHLFDPFFTTKNDGMGMGLTISQSIIQAHDGRIWVTLNPTGSGTTFHITLPLNEIPKPSLPDTA